jgi:ATP-dependent protease Clp ATPase subunit
MTSPLFRRGAMRGLKKLSPPVGGVHRRGSARTPIRNLGKEVVDVNDAIVIGVTIAGRTKLAEHIEDVIDVHFAIAIAVTIACGAWNTVDVD